MSSFIIPGGYVIWSSHPSELKEIHAFISSFIYPNIYWCLKYIMGGIFVLMNYTIRTIGQCYRRPNVSDSYQKTLNARARITASFSTQFLTAHSAWILSYNMFSCSLFFPLVTASKFCPRITLESKCSLFDDWYHASSSLLTLAGLLTSKLLSLPAISPTGKGVCRYMNGRKMSGCCIIRNGSLHPHSMEIKIAGSQVCSKILNGILLPYLVLKGNYQGKTRMESHYFLI